MRARFLIAIAAVAASCWRSLAGRAETRPPTARAERGAYIDEDGDPTATAQ